MSQKLTILFDLDGTLIDTAPDLMNAHNHVMKKFGYVERELNDIKKLAGRGSKVMIKKSIHETAERTGASLTGLIVNVNVVDDVYSPSLTFTVIIDEPL